MDLSEVSKSNDRSASSLAGDSLQRTNIIDIQIGTYTHLANISSL